MDWGDAASRWTSGNYAPLHKVSPQALSNNLTVSVNFFFRKYVLVISPYSRCERRVMNDILVSVLRRYRCLSKLSKD